MSDKHHTYRIPGRADRIVRDGGLPQDEPDLFKRYMQGYCVTRGKGYQRVVFLSQRDAFVIGDYLLSVAELLDTMTSEEKGPEGASEARAARAAAERLLDP